MSCTQSYAIATVVVACAMLIVIVLNQRAALRRGLEQSKAIFEFADHLRQASAEMRMLTSSVQRNRSSHLWVRA